MATRTPQPTTEDWKRLYEAGERYVRQRVWQYLDDVPLLGVEDPESKETFYCHVMGAAGMEFGVLAYRETGIGYHLLMLEERMEPDEIFVTQDCLAFSLGDREEASTSDRAVHLALGLRFRGRGAWPIYRSYRPGYAPVELDLQEVRSLATCLEQAYDFARAVDLGEEALPDLGFNNLAPLRKYSAGAGWATSVTAIPALQDPGLELDEGLIAQAKARARDRSTWEVLLVSMPPLKSGDEKPDFMPRLLFCVDQKTGVILDANMLEPEESLQAAFIHTVDKAQKRPRRVIVLSDYLGAHLAPLMDALGIDLLQSTALPMAEGAALEMKVALGIAL